jgi:hypothetical protein
MLTRCRKLVERQILNLTGERVLPAAHHPLGCHADECVGERLDDREWRLGQNRPEVHNRCATPLWWDIVDGERLCIPMKQLDAPIGCVAIFEDWGNAMGDTRHRYLAGPIVWQGCLGRDDGRMMAETLGGASGIERGTTRDVTTVGEEVARDVSKDEIIRVHGIPPNPNNSAVSSLVPLTAWVCIQA